MLSVLRLGNRWDLVFHQSLKRDAKGDVVEFDIDPRLMEQFAAEASAAIRKRMDAHHLFALVTTAETRPYVRMIIERMFPTLPVLSQLEVARGFEVEVAGNDLVMRYSGDSQRRPHCQCHPRECAVAFEHLCSMRAASPTVPMDPAPLVGAG